MSGLLKKALKGYRRIQLQTGVGAFLVYLFTILVKGEGRELLQYILFEGRSFKEAITIVFLLSLIGLLVAVLVGFLFVLVLAIEYKLNALLKFKYWFVDLCVYKFFPSKLGKLLEAQGFIASRTIKMWPLISESRNKKYSDGTGLPAFVFASDLDREDFWPDKNYSVVTIFDGTKIKQVKDESGKNCLLEIDISAEAYGIYSRGGKEFLKDKYEAASLSDEVRKREKEFHEYMLSPNQGAAPIVWDYSGLPITPFRWASGGYLSIVRWKGKNWVQFFFRDIGPVGLNLSNGASEDSEEHTNIFSLITREFPEETVLLSAKPSVDRTVKARRFAVPDNTGVTSARRLEPLEFATVHNQLRNLHDNLKIQESNEDSRRISSVATQFMVSVKSKAAKHPVETSNVIYSVNPQERGIEVIWICKFDLQENEVILDGEYDLAKNFLLRQPAVLVDMDFLKNVYRQNRGLGVLSDSKDAQGGKVMPIIPPEAIHVFDTDIHLRKPRLKFLQEMLMKDNLAENYEYKRISDWLNGYETAFSEWQQGVTDERLRTLCPVSWKTLEVLLAHEEFQL